MADSPPGEMVVSSTTNPASVSPPDEEDDAQVASPAIFSQPHHLRHSVDDHHHYRHRNLSDVHHLNHSRHQHSLQVNEVDIDSTTNEQIHYVPPSSSPPSEPQIDAGMMVDVNPSSLVQPSAPPAVAEEVIPYSESQNHNNLLHQFYDHNLNHQSLEQHHPSTSSGHHQHHLHQQSSSSLHMFMGTTSTDNYNGNSTHLSSYLPSIAHQHPHQVIRMYHPIGPEETSHHQLTEQLSNVPHPHSWSQPNYSQSLPNDMSLQDEYQPQLLTTSESSSRTTSQNGVCEEEREEDLSLNQRSHHLHHQSLNSNESLAHQQMMMCDDSLDRLHQQQSQIHHQLLHSQQHLQQSQDEIIIADVPVESRARASLPTSYLYIEPVDDFLDLPDVVYGVFARKSIPQRTQFGPVEGVIMQFTGNRNIQQPSLTVFISDTLILDQSDENKSNWMRFVRIASTFEEQNLILVTKEQTHPNPDNPRELITTTKFFFITTKPIGPRQELKVWYSKEYADRFRLKLLEDELVEGPTTPSEVQGQHHQISQEHYSDSNILVNRPVDQDSMSLAVPMDHHMNIQDQSSQNIGNECYQQQHHPERQETSYTALVPIPPDVVAPVPSASNDLHTSSTDLMPAAGHKLRNKIAKSQQQQLQLQKSQQSNQINISESSKSVSNVPSASAQFIGSAVAVRPEKSKEHRCDTCGKTFPRFYSLRRHMIMHSGEKKFKCPVCHMSFSHVYNRNRHVKRHSTNGQPGSEKKKEDALPPKVQLKEPVAPQPPSSSAPSDEPPAVKITRIIISDPNPKPKTPLPSSIKVIEIPQPVTSSTSVDTSLGVDREKSGGSSPSSNAPESTTPNIVRSMIVKAKMLRAGMAVKRFKCNQCYKFFSSDERLQKHNLVHSTDDKSKPLSCDICSKRFFNNSALSCHLKIHSSARDGPKQYECVLCHQWFDSNAARKEHVTSHLDASSQFTCPVCKKKFNEFASIRKHISAFHSDRQYPCHVCEKIFPRPDKLKLHMLRHSDLREFLCQSCGKQFKRKDKLKEHIQRMHSAERDVRLAQRAAVKAAVVGAEPFSSWNNSSQQQLNGSKKFVPKVSPNDYHRFIYKCHSCLLGFKRRGMLVNHLAKRHPETSPTAIPELNLPILKTTRDYYCQYCDKVYKSSSKRKSHILKNHPGLSLPISSRARGSLGLPPDVPNPTYSATVGSITTHPHPCSWCHKQYASKAKLLQHQRKKHPGKVENAAVRGRKILESEENNSAVSAPISRDHQQSVMLNPTINSSVQPSGVVPYPMMNEQVSVANTPNQMMNPTLIAILGNFVNNPATGSSTSTEAVAADQFQELMQSNPTVANDLLTQAMSELTNTHHNLHSKADHQSMIAGTSINWS